ncbi:MAG: type II toxin-antitoxin system VapC family toxin [Aestuariivirga sp.]
MILADTSAWIDFLGNKETPPAAALNRALGTDALVIGDLILVELLQGYRKGRALDELKGDLRPFPVVTLCGPALALQAADNYRLLRSKGVTVRGTIDVIIATWCIAHKVPLIHADRDFVGMEKWLGLKRWEH